MIKTKKLLKFDLGGFTILSVTEGYKMYVDSGCVWTSINGEEEEFFHLDKALKIDKFSLFEKSIELQNLDKTDWWIVNNATHQMFVTSCKKGQNIQRLIDCLQAIAILA